MGTEQTHPAVPHTQDISGKCPLLSLPLAKQGSAPVTVKAAQSTGEF